MFQLFAVIQDSYIDAGILLILLIKFDGVQCGDLGSDGLRVVRFDLNQPACVTLAERHSGRLKIVHLGGSLFFLDRRYG